MEAEELEAHLPFMAVEGMGDVRFARFQFQSHSC